MAMSSSTSKRSRAAPITVAYVVLWFVIVLAVRTSTRFLVDTALPNWIGRGLIESADALLLLSILIVPSAVWFHARLGRRRILPLAAHIGIGPATTSLAMLIAYFPIRGLEVVPRRFPGPIPPPAMFVFIVAAVIGGIASAAVWYFSIRHLPSRDAEIANRFD
jgi:hypothetical protein